MWSPDEIRRLAAEHGIKNQELADASGKSVSIVWKLLKGADKRIAYESVQAISEGLDKLIPAGVESEKINE